MTAEQTVDRPAAIRRALRDLVAVNGFHGASMSAVAAEAGVAAGTAYVHYASKEELVYATYLEIKAELADAVLAEHDPGATPPEQYRQMFVATFRHMAAEPQRARFLTQLEESPYYEHAHRLHLERGDRLAEALLPTMHELVVPLPLEVIWSMSLGVAVRLVAAGVTLTDEQLGMVVEATWRAVTVPVG